MSDEKRTLMIGLCGRSGSGKGYVAKKFSAYGIPSVDTDAVYRTLTAPAEEFSPCMRQLVDAFGEEIAFPDHSLNRRALSEIVFADGGERKREQLNRITHAHILRETKRIAAAHAASGAPAVLIDAPLLFESGFDAECDCTVSVTASDEVSIARIIKRDGISEAEAHRRLLSQISAQELTERCDYVIENGLNCETLDEQVKETLRRIFERFRIEEAPYERKD